MSLDLLQPVRNIVESGLLRAVVDQDNTHGTFVVSLCDRSESLLSCCVPYLQLNTLVLHVDCFDLKVDAYHKLVAHM